MMHTLPPVLSEPTPGRFTISHLDHLGRKRDPHLTLAWSDTAGAWALLDRVGIPYQGETRRILLAYVIRAFAGGLPPQVLEGVRRDLQHGDLLYLREEVA